MSSTNAPAFPKLEAMREMTAEERKAAIEAIRYNMNVLGYMVHDLSTCSPEPADKKIVGFIDGQLWRLGLLLSDLTAPPRSLKFTEIFKREGCFPTLES
jgi:hypothetical protein